MFGIDTDTIGGSILNSFSKGVISTVTSVGRAGLNALGPDNFEYYMCALKLIRNGELLAYMTFPVMPNSIMENKAAVASVTQTNNAIVTQYNSAFTPIDISLQGTFGRKLRILLGNKEYEEAEAESSFQKAQKFFNGNWSTGLSDFGVLVKTGYGLVQMLRHIIDACYKDNNILVFDNYTLNQHYIVEPLQRSFSQSTENNMIWYYNVELKAVADASKLSEYSTSVGSMIGQVALGGLVSTVGSVINDCLRMIAL